MKTILLILLLVPSISFAYKFNDGCFTVHANTHESPGKLLINGSVGGGNRCDCSTGQVTVYVKNGKGSTKAVRAIAENLRFGRSSTFSTNAYNSNNMQFWLPVAARVACIQNKEIIDGC